MKSIRIRSFSGPYFYALGLITVFNPNVGKFGPEKLRIRTLSTHNVPRSLITETLVKSKLFSESKKRKDYSKIRLLW